VSELLSESVVFFAVSCIGMCVHVHAASQFLGAMPTVSCGIWLGRLASNSYFIKWTMKSWQQETDNVMRGKASSISMEVQNTNFYHSF
jgi:hypothetical protein